MDGLLHPVGELDPGVYMRRRLVVLAFAILAILVVVFLLKAAFASGDGTPGPAPSTSPKPSESPAPTVSAADVRACGTGDLTVDLAPMTRDFAGSEFPSFEATITQTGLTPCAVDTTLPGTELLVTSGPTAGPERIWSSTDCESGALEAQRIVLAPDETRALQLLWPRIRSNEACASDLPNPLPGTYHALLTLNGVTSQNAATHGVTFTLSP